METAKLTYILNINFQISTCTITQYSNLINNLTNIFIIEKIGILSSYSLESKMSPEN